jgi:hypothetical protein
MILTTALVVALQDIALAEGKVTVNPARVTAGQPVTVSGTGWAPHDQILVSFTDPSGNILPLGLIAADANGNFTQTIVVPETVPPGTYQIDGNGQGGSVSVNLTIVTPTPMPVPPTPIPPPPTVTAPVSATSVVIAEDFTQTPTPFPTATSTPTGTSTPTLTATQTNTSTPTATSTSTSTPTPTTTPTLGERVVTTGRGAVPVALVVLIPIAVLAGYLVGRTRQ